MSSILPFRFLATSLIVSSISLLPINSSTAQVPTSEGVTTSTTLLSGLRARQVGPAVMSGRCSSIAVDPNDPKNIYIGSAGGGIWKSTTGGTTVRPIFDDYTMSIGKLAIAPSDSKTIYVGTGEPWVRNSVSIGTGMYKSTDAGSTWKAIGLDSTERISDILVHPTDPNTLYVAALGHLWDSNTQRGVFKSTDGGATWTRSLYIDEHTGASGLSMDPVNPDVLYVTVWGFRRQAWDFNSGFGGKSSLYKSTDGGATWKEFRGNGLPTGTLGRMDIEVAPTNPSRLYLSVEAEKKADKGLYRSDDGGVSWTLVSTDFGNTVRPFYFSNLIVSPHNDSIVAKCGLNAILSKDLGTTFRVLDGAMHSDIHDIWFDPQHEDHLLFATDGGIYESFDGGQTTRMWMNLPVSQFYHVAVDMEEPFNMYGGLQDNGSWVGPSRKAGGIGNNAWSNTYGGDGFYSFRHPIRKDIIYSEYQGGNLVRYNTTTGQAKSIAPYRQGDEQKLRWNWNSPLHQSIHQADRIYFAAQYFYRSDDTGDSWTRISPDLTTNAPEKQLQHKSGGLSIDNSTAENHCTIYSFAESKKNERILWVGSDDGRVHVTQNGGKSWNDVSIPSVKHAWISYLEASPHSEATAFATFDHHRSGDMNPYLYKTTDFGKSWTQLPTENVEGYALSVRQDLVNPNLLFLGTEFGLYVSLDGGFSWQRFENNFPKVGVRDMVIHPKTNSLVTATHGRGLILIDDISAWRQLSKEVLAEKIQFFTLAPTVLRDPGAGGNWFGGSGDFIGENPSTSAQIAYYADKRHTFGKMYIEVWRNGTKLRTLQAGKAAGLNVVNMPTARSKPKSAPSNNRMALVGSLFGPNLSAGTYDVLLVKGKDTFKTAFELQYDPNSPYGKTDREAQLALANKLYHQSERLAYVYATLEELAASAKTYDTDDETERKMLDSLHRAAERMMDRITFTGGDFYVDEGEKIREEISNLYFKVVQYPGLPTSPQEEEANRLEVDLTQVESDHKAMLAETLTPLNEVLAKAGKQQVTFISKEDFFDDETSGSSLGGQQQWYRFEENWGYDALQGSALANFWMLGLFR